MCSFSLDRITQFSRPCGPTLSLVLRKQRELGPGGVVTGSGSRRHICLGLNDSQSKMTISLHHHDAADTGAESLGHSALALSCQLGY